MTDATVGLIGHGLAGDVVDADDHGFVEEARGIPQGRTHDASNDVTEWKW